MFCHNFIYKCFEIGCDLQGKKHILLLFIYPNPSTEFDPKNKKINVN